MRGFEDIDSKGHFSAKKGFFWVKPPQGGHKKFGVKIKSKMNSAQSNYSECKFSAKSNNFKTIAIIRSNPSVSIAISEIQNHFHQNLRGALLPLGQLSPGMSRGFRKPKKLALKWQEGGYITAKIDFRLFYIENILDI